MPACFYDCPFSELEPDLKEVYLLMGYGGRTPPDEIVRLVTDTLAEMGGLCRPRCGFVVVDGTEQSRTGIRVGDTVFNTGAIITSAMRGAARFVFFAATVGQGYEEWFGRIREEDDMLKLFVADALGSVVAEAVVDWLIRRLGTDMAAQGWQMTNNYSPGYCDWNVREQPLLFSLFPPDSTGIRLTESCLMLPVKSVSGLIGVGPHVKKQPYGCAVCNMTNCVKNTKKT